MSVNQQDLCSNGLRCAMLGAIALAPRVRDVGAKDLGTSCLRPTTDTAK